MRSQKAPFVRTICGALLVVLPAAAWSQATTETPASCLKAANEYLNSHVAALRSAGKPLDITTVEPIRAESQRLAKTCAAKFDPKTVSSADFTALINLYRFYGDTTKAFEVVQRGIDEPNPPRQRAELLVLAIRLATTGAQPGSDTLARAETFMRQLDAMPNSLDSLKVQAHQVLLNEYDYKDADDMIRHHALAELAILRRTPMPAASLHAYVALARTAGDFGHPDSALMILDRAEREITGTLPPAQLASELAPYRAMYKLVGEHGAAISATHWINAPANQGDVTVGNGKVTLIQFTAHWCAPCRNSYPGFKRLAARYTNAPVDIVFSTGLYGQFESKQMDQASELAADRDYYVGRWGIPFKIAVQPVDARGTINEMRYAVYGIPQIVVIDKRGVIRQITIGWDAGNEARLGALIDRLVAER